MSKILTSLILAAFAFSAQAASHAGAAPMKDGAAAPAAAASAPKKAKKAAKAASGAVKKEEAKK